MSTLDSALGQLPQPILDKLHSMIRRVRRLLLLRGLCATLAVALVCLLAIMAVDAAVTLFSSVARWALSLAGLGATLAAAWWFLVRPLSRRFTLEKMARILEIRHPELQERISTAVELLSSDDPDSIRGSQELIAAVVDSAVADVAEVDPRAEFKPARSRKFFLAAAVCAAVVALSLAIWPKQAWTLMARAVAPFLDLGNAYADTLVVDPGDLRVAKGEPVTIQVSVKHKRLQRAEIRRRLPDGKEVVERMALLAEEPDGTKRFALTFPSVEADFDYRVRAGAALSRHFSVVAVEPPAVSALSVRYDYPDYTGLPDAESTSETGEIRAVARTRVTLAATLNKPVREARLFFNESEFAAAEPEIEDARATWEFELKPGMRGSWHLELADEEGFANQPSSYPVEVLPDKAPVVQIIAPAQREIRLKPTERLPLDLGIVEDFGFGDLVLLATPDGAVAPAEQVQSLPAPTERAGSYAARAVLDLPALRLGPDQRRLSVQARARDNRPADYDGPGVGLSEVIFVIIDENAKSLAEQAIEAQRQEVEQQIREARQELERARDSLRRAEQELPKTEEVNSEARRQLDDFTQRNEAARDKLDRIAAAIDTPLFQEQSRQAAKLADEPLAEAQEKVDTLPMTDERHERVAEAKEARAKVEEAIEGLDQLAKSMREAESDYQAIAKLNELANRQQELAMKAEDWERRAQQERTAAEQAAQQAADENARRQAMEQFDQQQRREAEQFRNEQNRVEQQLGEMLKENAAALAEVLEQQREQAGGLSEQAQALAERQEALREASRDATERSEDGQPALREALVQQLAQLQSQLAQQAKAAVAEQREQAETSGKGEGPQPEPAASESQASAGRPSPSEAPASAENQASASSEAEAKSQSPSETSAEQSAAPAEALAQAAEAAARAAEDLGEGKLDEAGASANEAGETFAQAAQAQAPQGEPRAQASADAASDSADPSATPDQPSAPARPEGGALPSPVALAERQQAIAEQIEAVRRGDLQEALARMEDLLASEAQALRRQSQGMAGTLQNLQQSQANSRAREADRSLERGAGEASESSQQLARAQEQQRASEAAGEVAENQLAAPARSSMQKGQSDQKQSADALAAAAQAFARASDAIGQTLEGLEPSDMDERLGNSSDLAEGFQDVARSSQSQDASQAASQSQQAADSLQQLAQSAMQQLAGQPGPQGPTQPDGEGSQPNPELAGEPDEASLNETGQKTADGFSGGIPPELRNLGISAEDWARFKGALAGGNANAIQSDLPAEYRELVGRYFQVIAKEAAKGR